jgi:hypothetical protein
MPPSPSPSPTEDLEELASAANWQPGRGGGAGSIPYNGVLLPWAPPLAAVCPPHPSPHPATVVVGSAIGGQIHDLGGQVCARGVRIHCWWSDPCPWLLDPPLVARSSSPGGGSRNPSGSGPQPRSRPRLGLGHGLFCFLFVQPRSTFEPSL